MLACLKTRFSTCRPLSEVKIMHEILIKLKLYGYKNDSNNVNVFYFRLFSAQWINGLQTVADADLQIRWGPGLPDSEIKRRGGGRGLGRFPLV